MTFNEAIKIISDVLRSTGTKINENGYDGIIVKKLEASNTLDEGRTTNQTHIAITGNQMDIFPYLRSEGYFNNLESDAVLKKYFITQVPITLTESNVRYLETENGVQVSEISFLAGQNKTQTSIIRSKRTNQADQIQVSLINFDGKDFIAFRKLLHSSSYLIILKRKEKFEYLAFGIIPGRGIEADGGLAQLNNQFYKLDTKTIVNIENVIPYNNQNGEDTSIENETMLIKYKKFYLDYVEDKNNQDWIEKNAILRDEFTKEYPLERLRTLTLKEYALGTVNYKDSLSYKLEFGKYKKVGLGIGGGSSAKHGIYFGKDNQYHDFKNDVISNPEEFWNELRNQIYSFLREIGETSVFPNIEKYSLVKNIPIVAVKLCYLYYPKKFISIGKKGTLEDILDMFELNVSNNEISAKKSYEINKYIRENILDVNENDPQYIGNALWKFVSSTDEEDTKAEGNNEITIDNIDESKRFEGGTNTLLYGVPGSGKSWTIEHEYCKPSTNVERLVFHPDYTYSDFIGQILPNVAEDGQVSYKFTPGPFTTILKDAYQNPDKEYMLIIEEINRGNAPAIFGEVFQLLDRKSENTQYDDEFPVGTSEYGITNENIAKEVYGDARHKVRIPSNLSIIGTMNTSDQNVFTLDTAFQRRWEMRLIENNFEHVDKKLADAEILDTRVTWKTFCTEINNIIVGNNARMTSAEDKRLGAYFIHLQDLIFDDKMGHLSEGEYDALRKKEENHNLNEGDKNRLAEIRNAMKQNRRFPEKVIKYLWDDAFKFNREIVFDTNEYQSLEQVIRKFMYSEGINRFDMFRDNVKDAFTHSEE